MNFKRLFERKYFQITIKNTIVFISFSILIGFSIGTITLLGPVRWIVNWGKSIDLTPTSEDVIIKFIIILIILVTAFLAAHVTKFLLNKKSSLLKLSVWIVLFLISGTFLWLWMNPSMINNESKEITTETAGNVQFVFGPYPSLESMIKLKNEGFTAVISLLHPAVIPFEPKLISDERELSERVGIKLIELPMLPWISENETSLSEIKKIASSESGKYYVHCYLGKDRVNVVKRIIQNNSAVIVISQDSLLRKLTDLGNFERGEIIELEKDVYLTPFPTDDEFFGYILNGYFKKVVSLLDPANPEDTMWIHHEEKICKSNMMPYELLPIKINPLDPEEILKIANKTKQMPRPLLIHAFLMKSVQTDAFIKAFKSP